MDKGTVRLELFRRNRLHSPDLPGYNRNIEKEDYILFSKEIGMLKFTNSLPERNMNLQQLRYIVEIADSCSITKASKKLFVSQPYLSKVVSDFEARAKKQIFIRCRNGLELTAYGQKVYLLAQSIIHQMDQLGKEETAQNDSVRLSFSAANLIIKDSLLLDYVSTVHAAQIDIDFCETTISGCIKKIEEDVSEFAIVVADDFQKTLLTSICVRKKLEWIELDEGCPYIHFHRKHSLANQDEIHMNHLMPYVFVRLKTDEFTAFSRKKLKEEYPEISAQRCIVVNHYHTYLSMVKHNAAFMIGNKWQISELEKMGIQSAVFSSFKHKVHLMILKKQSTVFSAEAARWIHLFKNSYGLDET